MNVIQLTVDLNMTGDNRIGRFVLILLIKRDNFSGLDILLRSDLCRHLVSTL
jgi:hypothetical protein